MEIDDLKIEKPKWYQDPPTFDFNLIKKPIAESYESITAKLEEATSQSQHFIFCIKEILKASFQTYRAICKLVAKDPKYPFQAHILGRTSIEALAVVILLVESPEENTGKYQNAGYRNQWEDYKCKYDKYKDDPKWKDWLDLKKKSLNYAADLCGLTEEERKDSKIIKYWPTFSQILKGSERGVISLSAEKQAFLKEIETWHYGELSEWTHLGEGGIAISAFADKPEYQWTPGKCESDAVYRGVLFLLMLLSEIEVLFNYGENQNLRYIWTILNSYIEEAKDYYDFRYDTLLEKE